MFFSHTLFGSLGEKLCNFESATLCPLIKDHEQVRIPVNVGIAFLEHLNFSYLS